MTTTSPKLSSRKRELSLDRVLVSSLLLKEMWGLNNKTLFSLFLPDRCVHLEMRFSPQNHYTEMRFLVLNQYRTYEEVWGILHPCVISYKTHFILQKKTYATEYQFFYRTYKPIQKGISVKNLDSMEWYVPERGREKTWRVFNRLTIDISWTSKKQNKI